MSMFTKHLEGCTPMNPCLNCCAVRYLSEHLSEEEYYECEDSGFSLEMPDEHLPECSPDNRCARCLSYHVFREVLGERFSSFKEYIQVQKELSLFKPQCSVRLESILKNIANEKGRPLTNGDVVNMTQREFLDIPGSGRKILNELNEVLTAQNLPRLQ